MPSQVFKSFIKHKHSHTIYKARFISIFAVSPVFVMQIDKTKEQILADRVILALVYRNRIYRLINYEFFIV